MFTETAAGWKKTDGLTGSAFLVGNDFGISVAISGTVAVVGAPNFTLGGRAYVFED